MANTTPFTIQIPTAVVSRIAAAFCGSYGYSATLDDGTDNPVTPVQFTRQQVIEYIRAVVIAYEANVAAETARQTAADTAQTDIALT